MSLMTAAHAFEYEVPPHAGPPPEAVEAAEEGNVVYLTRQGQRVAAMGPPTSLDPQGLEKIGQYLQTVAGNPNRTPALRTWAREQLAQLDEIMEQVINEEDAEACDDALASMRAGESTQPWSAVKRELDL
ncbi:hypothetical protein GA0070216_103468 [Micromonospora matsumotoense]|uniref:Uncharacterized protein n=2 Tax=Micromonospora matsumotoense TaxID=121616 RepID=A0A1C4WMZ4_9ACTN|nr:hypothetical protein GA0070216_103468 [Micromonospora matsumotoense]